MAEIYFFPIQVKNGWSAEYAGLEGFLEKRTHMKIVVPFQIDDFDLILVQSPELFKHRQVVGEGDLGVTDPELEQVAQDKKGVGVSRQFGQEIEQKPIVFIRFAFKMGICDKYLAHDRTITEKKVKVKVEVKKTKSPFFRFFCRNLYLNLPYKGF
jgi:hypothetical protein